MIKNRLNHRPRKRLGFKTPHEVFHASLNRVAVRTWIRILFKVAQSFKSEYIVFNNFYIFSV